jgi:hypothetical protein
MTFWDFLDRQFGRLPGWPSERQVITYMNVALIWIMLRMARENGTLWDVELFKVILQALALTGFLNMAMAFFFAANRGDEQRSQDRGKLVDTVKALAQRTGEGDDAKK